jgi:hypothetical protein
VHVVAQRSGHERVDGTVRMGVFLHPRCWSWTGSAGVGVRSWRREGYNVGPAFHPEQQERTYGPCPGWACSSQTSIASWRVEDLLLAHEIDLPRLAKQVFPMYFVSPVQLRVVRVPSICLDAGDTPICCTPFSAVDILYYITTCEVVSSLKRIRLQPSTSRANPTSARQCCRGPGFGTVPACTWGGVKSWTSELLSISENILQRYKFN